MKVSELLQGIPCTGTYNDVEVLDVTQDSRLVEPGYLFVCIKGASFDGHAVAAEMLEKGAVAVVCDHDMGLPSQVITPNTRDAYATICANYYGNPAEKLQLIGLTGTNGKTTNDPTKCEKDVEHLQNFNSLRFEFLYCHSFFVLLIIEEYIRTVR